MKLEPCPFCGATNLCQQRNEGWYSFWVACEGCGARGPETMIEPEAGSLWNARETARHVPARAEVVISLDSFDECKGA